MPRDLTEPSRFKNLFAGIPSFQIRIPQLLCGDFFNSVGHDRSFDGVCSMSGLHPKADFPILELPPPPTLRERRHRGLARRRVAMRQRAIFVLPEG
jgi:hypothetical protein